MPDATSVTVAEIQEIYLQIKGSRPGQIPSRDVMGYNAAAVISCVKAVEQITAANWEETVKARAVALAFCLDHQSPFRDQNRLVALHVAMYFLIKNGFKIGGGALPRRGHFSQGNVLAWLNQISEAP